MSNRQAVWIDVERCTGCGACIEVCPQGAIALMDGRAQVDDTLCTGCEVCIEACPESAIQPVIEGELVAASERPAPVVHRPGSLIETAGVAVAAASAGLLVRMGGALMRAVGRWLTSRPDATGVADQRNDVTAGASSPVNNVGRGGRGRRARHRQGRRGEMSG